MFFMLLIRGDRRELESLISCQELRINNGGQFHSLIAILSHALAPCQSSAVYHEWFWCYDYFSVTCFVDRFQPEGPLKAYKTRHSQIILCNIFTATVGLLFISCCALSVLRFQDFLPFPTSTVCFNSLPLYTLPKAPSPIILSKEISSKTTSNGSESSELDLKTCFNSSSWLLRVISIIA